MKKNKTEKRRTGDRGERRTALYLILRGYRILERNYTYGHKEIDIIASKGKTIAFVEVKTRSDLSVAPQTAVTLKKRQNVITAAKGYCLYHDIKEKTLRFDIAEVPVKGRINYIKNAYSGQ
ncbi:MAG: YraN family protein [Clostridiales bacterium]|nr:YraN family protein [Clostridiales bacterium]